MQTKWLVRLLLTIATVSGAKAQVEVGDMPPDLLGIDQKGNEVLVSAHRGKVVVLSFWASWCPYCLKELPVLEKIQQVVGKSRIEVIAINIDRNRGDFLAMQRQLKKFQLTMARDEHRAVVDVYGANALPYLLMVSKEGRVAHLYKGYSEKLLDGFVTEINALLDEPDVPMSQPAAGD